MIVAVTQFLYYLTCHALLTLLLRARVDVARVDPATLRPPLIVAANHPSRIDPFLLVLLPFRLVRRIVPLYFLTAAIYYDRWWIGPLARLIGAYRLPPTGWSIDDYLGTSLHLLRREKTVVLFPEGQLTAEDQERQPKSGVGQLALRTGAVILPLRVKGAATMRFSDILRRRARVELIAGPLINVERRQPTRESSRQLAHQLMQTIRSL